MPKTPKNKRASLASAKATHTPAKAAVAGPAAPTTATPVNGNGNGNTNGNGTASPRTPGMAGIRVFPQDELRPYMREVSPLESVS